MTLIEALRETIRRLHDSPRTEEAYVHWTRAFILEIEWSGAAGRVSTTG